MTPASEPGGLDTALEAAAVLLQETPGDKVAVTDTALEALAEVGLLGALFLRDGTDLMLVGVTAHPTFRKLERHARGQRLRGYRVPQGSAPMLEAILESNDSLYLPDNSEFMRELTAPLPQAVHELALQSFGRTPVCMAAIPGEAGARGVLLVSGPELREEDRTPLRLFAHLISVSLDKIDLRRGRDELAVQVRQHEEDLYLLGRLYDAGATGDLPSLAQLLTQETARLFGRTGVSLYLYDPESQVLSLASFLIHPAAQNALTKLLGSDVHLRVQILIEPGTAHAELLELRVPRVVSDRELIRRITIEHAPTRALKAVVPGILPLLRYAHILYVPLISNDRCLGLISLAQRAPIEPMLVRRLSRLTGPITAALARSRAQHTERALEDEQLRAYKLESLGVLAGGIAHDFNNLLTVVRGNLSVALDDTEGEVRQALSEAQAASVQATQLTRQLLVFSKGGAPVKQAASLAEIVEEASRFATHGSRTRVSLHVSDDLWPASVDSGQIYQVIHNICLNAVQQMPEGGTLLVTLGNLPNLPGSSGQAVEIAIEDEGPGIPDDHLTRIFDPYFTTRDTGSGLGLATAYGVVKRHGGRLRAENTRRGARFTITLPAAVAAPVVQPLPPPQPRRSGEARVLLLDDETLVRRLGTRALSRLGYTCEAAATGAEAVELFRRALATRRPFDVAVLDLTVPGGMGGVETLAALRVLDPSIRVIVSSGYSTDEVMAHHQEHGFQGVVAKPWDLSTLQRVIEEVLAR